MKAVFKHSLFGNKTNVLPFGEKSTIGEVLWDNGNLFLFVEHAAEKKDPESKTLTPITDRFLEVRFVVSYEPVEDDWIFLSTISSKVWVPLSPTSAMKQPKTWIYHVYYRVVSTSAPSDEEIAAALA